MAETQNRIPRDMQSREKSARMVYTPSSSLPDPTPEPGYVYRWVATHVLGQSDPTNVSKKMREGWEPVKAVDHPELMLPGNEKTGNVEIGGKRKLRWTQWTTTSCETMIHGCRCSRTASPARRAEVGLVLVQSNLGVLKWHLLLLPTAYGL
jgi:hypothetical protein